MLPAPKCTAVAVTCPFNSCTGSRTRAGSSASPERDRDSYMHRPICALSCIHESSTRPPRPARRAPHERLRPQKSHRREHRTLLVGRPVADLPHHGDPRRRGARDAPHHRARRPPQPARAQPHPGRARRTRPVAALTRPPAARARTVPHAPVLRGKPRCERGRRPPHSARGRGAAPPRRPHRDRHPQRTPRGRDRHRAHPAHRHARPRHRPRARRTRLARRHPAPTRGGRAMTARLTAALDAIAARHAARPGVHALRCGIEHPASGFRWRAGAADESYPIASITKLYTTALVMQLRAEGAFGLDTPAATLLEAGTLDGLVVHDGRDWADAITVRELLAQTSGIPDYFEQPRADGTTFLRGALAQDAWTSLDDHLELSRTLPSPFPPSTPGRSHYSDTNFELLGRIVERVTGDSYAAALQTRILDPLGATGTRLFTGEETPDGPVTPVYHGRTALHLPR